MIHLGHRVPHHEKTVDLREAGEEGRIVRNDLRCRLERISEIAVDNPLALDDPYVGLFRITRETIRIRLDFLLLAMTKDEPCVRFACRAVDMQNIRFRDTVESLQGRRAIEIQKGC
jgi:hypothetical protein